MYGRRTSSRRASAAETLASCIRLSVPSIMRAPPEQETITSGSLRSMARSTARVTFSPTTAPIEPPMKPNSIEQHITGRPLSRPSAVRIASAMPSFLRASFRRSAYGLVSTKCSGSLEASCASCSIQRPSSSSSSRCRAFRRKWCWHFGQTRRLLSRSFFQTMARQLDALGPQPFGLDAPLVGRRRLLDRFFSRLNQAMSIFSASLAITDLICRGKPVPRPPGNSGASK